MRNNDSSGTSKTDWTRIDALADDDIDTSDSPELTDDFFKRATWRRGKSLTVTLELDPEVLAWYQAQGGDWERRLRAALRMYAEAHARS